MPWNATCNGIWDCLDGGDEPAICGIHQGEKTSKLRIFLGWSLTSG